MSKITSSSAVEAVRAFAEHLGCPPEVIANIGNPFRRQRRWAVRRLGERLETLLDETLPSDEEALGTALRSLRARRRGQ